MSYKFTCIFPTQITEFPELYTIEARWYPSAQKVLEIARNFTKHEQKVVVLETNFKIKLKEKTTSKIPKNCVRIYLDSKFGSSVKGNLDDFERKYTGE